MSAETRHVVWFTLALLLAVVVAAVYFRLTERGPAGGEGAGHPEHVEGMAPSD